MGVEGVRGGMKWLNSCTYPCRVIHQKFSADYTIFIQVNPEVTFSCGAVG